jgi:hypothetical protein
MPKCGGTSIRKALFNVYKPWSLEGVAITLKLNEMATREAEHLAGPHSRYIRTDLLNYHLSMKNLKCIIGHYRFSRETFERFKNDWHFITILRNPVERWYSHYFYARNIDSIYNIDMELNEFVETEKALYMGSSFIGVVTGETSLDKQRSQEYIEEAISILSKFTIVGFLENLNQFCKDFKTKFNKNLNIPHLNVTPSEKRKGWHNIPDVIHEKVLEICRPNIEIYKNIKKQRC